MAKLVYVSRKKIKKGRRKMEKMLAKDKTWQDELKRIKQFEVEEKVRRDAEHNARQKPVQTQLEESK